MHFVVHLLHNGHNHQNGSYANNGGFVKADANGQTHTCRGPQTGGSGQALDLVATGDDDGACT